jgi:hypothetical protein
MTTRPHTGGFLKPVQWGPWIRDTLSDGHQTYGYELYSQYKAYSQSFPTRRGTKRRVASYRTFTTYLYVLRELKLIEYVLDKDQNILTSEATGKDGLPAPDLAPRHYFRAVPVRLGDQAWGDPWFAYLGYKPVRKK